MGNGCYCIQINDPEDRTGNMDDAEDLEDLELLEKTLDEVMLRSPISPDKAWDYYRLSFGEDHASSTGQARRGPNAAGNNDGDTTGRCLKNVETEGVRYCKIGLRGSPKLSEYRSRNNTELSELLLSGLHSSPFTIANSANTRGGLNKNLAGKQLTAPSQHNIITVNQKADLSCDTNTTSNVNAGGLLFTIDQNIKATRPKSLATVGRSGVCLPLTLEKVKAVTAGEGNNPIDIHGETFPYADEVDYTDILHSTSNCDKRLAHSERDFTRNRGGTDGCDPEMYRYGYGSHSDNGYRRYQSGSSSSSSYRSPTLSQRSSFSRPTMISSISPISNRNRDTSYTSSSLRRSTSLGNDRPYYSGTRLHYDYSTPRTGSYSPLTYRRTFTSDSSRDSKSEDTSKDAIDGKVSNSNISQHSGDSNVVGSKTIESADVIVRKSPGSSTDSRLSSYSGITNNNNNVKTEPGVKSGASGNKMTDGEGYKKVSGRVYINMNYERRDPSEGATQQRTSSEQVMKPSTQKKASSEYTQPLNLSGDGPSDETKAVSQVKLNILPEKQNRNAHNRQIWSRPVDSTNISSENYSEVERKGRSEVLQPGPIIVKDISQVHRNNPDIDLKLSDKDKPDKCDSTEAVKERRNFKSSYDYCSHLSRDLTSKPPWYSTMGANVQSTHSSASSNEETEANMEGSSRRLDNRDRYRNRHRSEEEDYVLTESTASFVFRDGKWVPETDTQDNASSTRTSQNVTSTYKAPPLSSTARTNSTSSDTRYSDSSTTRGRDIPYRSTSQSSAGSVSPSKYESASSMPDSPVISKTQFYSRGDNSARHGDRHIDNRDTASSSGQSDNTAMNLYTERMNIISGFDRQDKDMDREKPQKTFITDKLQIPMSPPTFTVGGSSDNEQSTSRDSGRSSTTANNSRYSQMSDGREKVKLTGEPWYRSTRYGDISSTRGTKAPSRDDGSMETAAKTSIQSYHTPYYVTEPPEEEINRTDRNDSSSSGSEKFQSDYNTVLFIDEEDSRGTTGDASNSMGALTSTSNSTSGNKLERSLTRATPELFKSNLGTSESRSNSGNQERANLPAGVVDNTASSSVSTRRPYSGENVNRENYTTSSAASTEVNRTGLNGSDRDSQRTGVNQVTRGGTDVRGRDQGTLSIGEKSTVSTNERIDTVSTTERPELTTQVQRNSSDRESLGLDNRSADSTRDTRGFTELESMSSNQISERRGGIYYNENVSRRNVTGILASDQDDRRRALALSQTETQRSGEMVQTNDKSEVRQLHAGQASTRKAAGVEVSKDGDRVRSREVTDTVDRNRTDTEYKTETPSGLEVSKVREDRQSHSHQDRQEQSELKEDGREITKSSTSKSESAQVSRVTESGDSRVSQRQERHFKSSRVTRSSRTSGSGFSRDGFSQKAVGFGSDDSDEEDWPGNSSSGRDSGDGSALTTGRGVDKYTRRHSDSDNDTSDDKDDPYRETIVHENKAAEVLTNSVSRTDKEGTITLAEQKQRGLLDRGVTRNISEDGNITTQRVQQRQQFQSAHRSASSSYSRTSGNSPGDSGTVSAEDEAVILAALLGRLEEKEVEPFSPRDHLSRLAPMSSESGAVVPLVRNTEDVEGEENILSPEEQSRAIAQARMEFQARQAKIRRPIARKRTIIVDEETMEELFLRCIICRDRYDTDEKKPTMLPCHHTFCLECLKEMFRVESEHRQTLTTAYRDSAPSFVTIHCPTCRASHMITDKDFTTYKSDHKVIELLEISASPSKGHLGYCKTHRTQVTDHFCETCFYAICSDCKVLDHREQDDHVVYSRAEALKLYSNQAFITTHAADTEDRKLADMEKKLSGALEAINTKLTSSEQKIRQTFDKFKVSINNRQDQLLEKIENEMGSRREDFSGDLGEITKRLETIEKTQTTTRQAQEDEDVEQMFTAHQNAREMFKNNFEPVKDQKPNIKASFHYDKRDRVNIMNTVSDHGMITFRS